MLSSEDLVKAYAGNTGNGHVHVNPSHVEGLRRVYEAALADAEKLLAERANTVAAQKGGGAQKSQPWYNAAKLLHSVQAGDGS
jgi:hypothetical protein